jgi:DNA-directed RNA polymerase subunit RPC12/RpoP
MLAIYKCNVCNNKGYLEIEIAEWLNQDVEVKCPNCEHIMKQINGEFQPDE